MPETAVSDEIAQPAPVPGLLVELPPRRAAFFDNVRELIRPADTSSIELRSLPGDFWPDVFVQRDLPWRRFLESVGYHIAGLALLVVLTHFFAMQPRVISQSAFDRSQVVYYHADEYLPPLDTGSARRSKASKAEPELSRQEIISVPRESDNRAQTIVAPPRVKLKRDVALPNMVAWSANSSENLTKPQLAIAPAQLTLAADIARIAPKIASNVVAPPPEAAQMTHRREAPNMQSSVVAPPPSVDATSTRSLGQLNIGHSAVIAPSPQLAVAEQRAALGGRAGAIAPSAQVVPPPPSLGALGSSGSRAGRAIALNLHPAVGAPVATPAGNRRGSFAATPNGKAGASGSPGSEGGSSVDNGSAAKGKGSRDLPAGLYVGGAAKTSERTLTASVSAARASGSASSDSAKLSAEERAVFGDRKFYSLMLSMPNLNSSGGSWVIRFAELKQDPHAPADLSQPSATRKVDPGYPLQLMRENVAGTVILYAIIHADGSVGNVRVLSSVDERLDQYASAALARWQFHPATKNGTPVDVEATFKIPFRPQRVGTNF
jgi:TonB family protein